MLVYQFNLILITSPQIIDMKSYFKNVLDTSMTTHIILQHILFSVMWMLEKSCLNRTTGKVIQPKTLNFSIDYGKTGHALLQDWGVSMDEASAMLEASYNSRPEC